MGAFQAIRRYIAGGVGNDIHLTARMHDESDESKGGMLEVYLAGALATLNLDLDMEATDLAAAILASLTGLPITNDVTAALIDTAIKATAQPVSATALNTLAPATANVENPALAVSSTSVPLADWPATGRVTAIIFCETADVCWSVAGDAVAAVHPILRVGDSITLADVNAATVIPEFIRAGAADGQIRANYLIRA